MRAVLSALVGDDHFLVKANDGLDGNLASGLRIRNGIPRQPYALRLAPLTHLTPIPLGPGRFDWLRGPYATYYTQTGWTGDAYLQLGLQFSRFQVAYYYQGYTIHDGQMKSTSVLRWRN